MRTEAPYTDYDDALASLGDDFIGGSRAAAVVVVLLTFLVPSTLLLSAVAVDFSLHFLLPAFSFLLSANAATLATAADVGSYLSVSSLTSAALLLL